MIIFTLLFHTDDVDGETKKNNSVDSNDAQHIVDKILL